MLRITLLAAVLFALSAALFAHPGPVPASEFPQRATLLLVARDAESAAPPVTATRRPPPPPGPGYCGPSLTASPTPPNAVFGLLAIGGVQAPVETLVTLTFDGEPGISEYTVAAGGYRVYYAAGGQGHDPRCINEVGSELGLLINGVRIDMGAKVGDESTRPALRFDVSID